MICTLSTEDCTLAADLLSLRRELIAAGESERNKLHATTDSQPVRDRVFEILGDHKFRVDTTLLEKSKAQPQTRLDEPTFYQYAWYYHFKHIGQQIMRGADKTLIMAAALGSKRTRAAFKQAVNNTIQQIVPRDRWEVGFMESSQEPMLWAADYCAWAVQRKWEREDLRSYSLIEKKISTEFDLWKHGVRHFY